MIRFLLCSFALACLFCGCAKKRESVPDSWPGGRMVIERSSSPIELKNGSIVLDTDTLRYASKNDFRVDEPVTSLEIQSQCTYIEPSEVENLAKVQQFHGSVQATNRALRVREALPRELYQFFPDRDKVRARCDLTIVAKNDVGSTRTQQLRLEGVQLSPPEKLQVRLENDDRWEPTNAIGEASFDSLQLQANDEAEGELKLHCASFEQNFGVVGLRSFKLGEKLLEAAAAGWDDRAMRLPNPSQVCHFSLQTPLNKLYLSQKTVLNFNQPQLQLKLTRKHHLDARTPSSLTLWRLQVSNPHGMAVMIGLPRPRAASWVGVRCYPTNPMEVRVNSHQELISYHPSKDWAGVSKDETYLLIAAHSTAHIDGKVSFSNDNFVERRSLAANLASEFEKACTKEFQLGYLYSPRELSELEVIQYDDLEHSNVSKRYSLPHATNPQFFD